MYVAAAAWIQSRSGGIYKLAFFPLRKFQDSRVKTTIFLKRETANVRVNSFQNSRTYILNLTMLPTEKKHRHVTVRSKNTSWFVKKRRWMQVDLTYI